MGKETKDFPVHLPADIGESFYTLSDDIDIPKNTLVNALVKMLLEKKVDIRPYLPEKHKHKIKGFDNPPYTEGAIGSIIILEPIGEENTNGPRQYKIVNYNSISNQSGACKGSQVVHGEQISQDFKTPVIEPVNDINTQGIVKIEEKRPTISRVNIMRRTANG